MPGRPRARFAGLLLSLTAVGLASPGVATVPPPVPMDSYYGPIRVCEPLFAFDVREGEGYVHGGHTIWTRGAAHGIGDRWIYAGDEYRDIVRPLGEIEMPEIGRLERVALSSRNASGTNIIYLFDTHDRSRWPKLMISSTAFDGSEHDREILGRFAIGERARAMCPAPQELRPDPQRENSDARWLDPTEHRGPLTICMGGLAFDVGAGETALLPWRRDWFFFRIVSDVRRVNVEGHFPSVLQRGGPPPVQGSLASDPRFVVQEGSPPPSIHAVRVLRFSPGSLQVRLLRRADLEAYGPDGGSPVIFMFDGPTAETERLAFIGRLRTQRPDDACLEMESL